jgi:hypothetical protein
VGIMLGTRGGASSAMVKSKVMEIRGFSASA